MSGATGLAIGSFMQSFLAARQRKEEKEMQDAEVKARTKLYEIELQKAQRDQQKFDLETTQATERKQAQEQLFSALQERAAAGQSLADALADAQLLPLMVKSGLKREDLGVEKPPGDIQSLQILADPKNANLLATKERLSRAGATNVSFGGPETKFGTPPPGTMIQMTPEGPQMKFVPGPGNPALIEQEQAQTKEANRASAILSNAANVQSSISDALSLIGPMTTGFVGAKASEIEGTDAFTLARTIASIKSNLGVDKIAEMRANSPTGGALGNTSNIELDGLQSTVAALDIGLPPEKLKQNLKRVESHYNNWVKLVSGKKVGLGATPPALGAKPDNNGFVAGQEYTDAQGNRAVYLGNGQWKPL